jgi:hypothetical protein
MRLGFLYATVCAIGLSFGCVTDATTDTDEQESGANTDKDNTPDNNTDPNNQNQQNDNTPSGCSNTSEVCYCNANADCRTGFTCQIADSPPPPFQGICFPAQNCNTGNCQ